jgi:outer membrane protein OmpA-like peptidoglycan-associated protein
MKKIIALFIIVLSAFYTVTLITSCTTPPPPPPPATTPTPPPEEPAAPPPDTSPPVISVEVTPQPYSPINPDGEEQLLTAKINVKSASPIFGWKLEIREPGSNELFWVYGQEGEVPETVNWDGRNIAGELVESATVYNYSLTVSNIYNESTTYQGTIAIDVLVQREERSVLRIIVPSIIFAPDTGELTTRLDPATAANNERILKRIAEVLNYFEAYNVRVEGHSNPVYPPNSRQRASEEAGTATILGLQPLSERRAKSVVDYLVKLGIDPSRLSSVGMGGTRVRVEFEDRANWWKNRRVEFILEKPETDEE